MTPPVPDVQIPAVPGAGGAHGAPRPASPRGGLGSHIAALRTRAAIAYPKSAPTIALAFILVLGARVQEAIPALTVIRPLIIATLIGGTILLRQTRFPAFRSAMSDVMLRLTIVYFGWALITAPFGLWPGQSISSAWKQIFTVLTMVAILLCGPTLENVRRLRTGVVYSVGAYGMLFLIVAKPLGNSGRFATSGMYDTNDSAALFALCVPLALACVIREKGRRRLLGGLALLGMIAAIVRTGSRGGTVALAVGCLVFTLYQPGLRRVVVLAAMVIGGALMWNFGTQTFRTRIGALVRGEEDYNQTSQSGREQIWKRGLIYAQRRPIMGVGMNNFPLAEGEYFEEQGMTGKWSAPHNAYLQALVELGLVGAVMFVSLVGGSLRRAARLARKRAVDPMPELIASLAAYSVAAYFLSHAYFFMLFMLVALIGLAERAARNARNARPPAVATAPRFRGRIPVAAAAS